jgi:hypothetical protein
MHPPGLWPDTYPRFRPSCTNSRITSLASFRPGHQPQRGIGRLHGLVDHGQQVSGQQVEIGLLPEPGGEDLDGLGGVVAAAVEMPVDQVLDSPPAVTGTLRPA